MRVVKKPEERKREIIFAAQELFLEKEYEKTTLQDVMNKLGIAKGTVYHYFHSKEALLDAVVENMAETFVNRLRFTLEAVQGDGLKRMKALMRAGQVANEEDKMLKQLHAPGNMGLHTRLLAVIITKLAPLYAEVICQGCKEGIFKTEHPLESAEVLLAGIQFITDVGIYPWTKEEIARRNAAFPSLAEKQLGAKKGLLSFMFQNEE